MRWALGVRDAAKTSCYEAERIRHGQCQWRRVAVKGICASESLTLQNHYLPHVTWKETPRLALPLHPLCSGKRAQRVLAEPKSTVPAREECLASRSDVLLSQARARQARQGRAPAFHTVGTAGCSEIKCSPGKLVQFRLLRLSYALRDMEWFKRTEICPEHFSCCQHVCR